MERDLASGIESHRGPVGAAGSDRLLNRVSAGLCESAARLHRAELERLAHRALTTVRFEEMMADLKQRIAAWRAIHGTRGSSIQAAA